MQPAIPARLAGAQNAQIRIASVVIGIEPKSAQADTCALGVDQRKLQNVASLLDRRPRGSPTRGGEGLAAAARGAAGRFAGRGAGLAGRAWVTGRPCPVAEAAAAGARAESGVGAAGRGWPGGAGRPGQGSGGAGGVPRQAGAKDAGLPQGCDQTARTCAACGPLGPCRTVYSTFWFSSSVR